MGNFRSDIQFFTTCKPFEGEAGLHQRNGLLTWKALGLDVLLLGDDAGTNAVAADLRFRHVPTIPLTDKNIPTISGLFETAENESTSPSLAYVNSDILMKPELAPVFQAVADLQKTGPFLVTARRRNIPVGEVLELHSCENRINTLDQQYGSWDQPNAIDMFLFSRGLFDHIPDFAIGRASWDNWLLWKAQDRGAKIIDVSLDAALLHPIHGYASSGSQWGQLMHSSAAQKNREIAEGDGLTLNNAVSHVMKNHKVLAVEDTPESLLTVLLESTQPDREKELKSGLQHLVQTTASSQEINDIAKTVLWRNEMFFPHYNPSVADVDALKMGGDDEYAMATGAALNSAAEKVQEQVCVRFVTTMRDVAEAGRPIAIWGCGQAGIRLKAFLGRQGIPIAAFLDSRACQPDEHHEGLPLFTAKVYLQKDRQEGPKPFICLASMYMQEMAVSLTAFGYVQGFDYSG
ncbi:MAG: hypothetical protein JKY34_10955 [Kordiimonadaceae bacterium]|nr:hypothetical protein [Kordiimonadaceae bacterium]